MSYYTLTAKEARIIGCLIEKSIVTPDHYPMSINALTNACNQKSSRDPVLEYTDVEVQDGIDGLVERSLVTEIFHHGSRVPKYQHRFCNTEFSDLQFDAGETAIICLLLLRGPQTPGELRSRSGRLHTFKGVPDVEQALVSLKEKTSGPFVELLPREPGKRDARYQELFCSQSNITETNATDSFEMNAPQSDLQDRIDALEQTVADLSERLAALEAQTEL
ncbi:MAG: DUF480 domain-containing protein [Marinomonas atlantica]|nr:DUF480 domain-containing protein [Marinomonas atlantica]